MVQLKITGESALYYQAGATHVWSNSPSTSAGATTSWDERMRIDASGNVEIGGSTATGSLKVINTNTQVCVFDRRGTDGLFS